MSHDTRATLSFDDYACPSSVTQSDTIPFSFLMFSFVASTFIFDNTIVIRISMMNGIHKYMTCNMVSADAG